MAPSPGLGDYTSTQIAQIEASALIFDATVLAVHAKTVPDPIDTTSTVVVNVDSVAFADTGVAELGGAIGHSITVQLQNTNLGVGDHVFLLSRVQLYNGGELEVAELGRVDLAQYPTFAADVPRIETLLATNPLYARIASSTQIVSGQVTAIAPAVDDGSQSEHSPLWRVSNVSPGEVLCGSIGDAGVTAAYPSSVDIAWYQAPKLAVDQEAVLLIHRPVVQSPGEQTPDRIVVDPLDVHPLADLPQIQALLDSPPALP